MPAATSAGCNERRRRMAQTEDGFTAERGCCCSCTFAVAGRIEIRQERTTFFCDIKMPNHLRNTEFTYVRSVPSSIEQWLEDDQPLLKSSSCFVQAQSSCNLEQKTLSACSMYRLGRDF